MAGVRIVTDSACDLGNDVVDELGIRVVPLTIRFGDDEYVDREELSPQDFYRKMAATSQLPETAAPAPGAFEQAFSALTDDGADAVVCINISSELSATMQSAQTAAKSLEGKADVRIFDSRSITAGLGTQVTEAARAAREGKSADEVVALLEDLRARTRILGALDTLENLKKGGRVGGAQALVGSLLSIKPLVDLSSGKVEEAGRQRTRRKSLVWLRDRLREYDGVQHLAVMHADAKDIDEFLDLLEPDHPRDSVHVGLIGPVIGTHGGPGTIGVCWVAPR